MSHIIYSNTFYAIVYANYRLLAYIMLLCFVKSTAQKDMFIILSNMSAGGFQLQKKTWFNARKDCEASHEHLAVLNTVGLINFFKTYRAINKGKGFIHMHYTHTHEHTQTHTHEHTPMDTHTYTHEHTHTRTHMRSHTRIHR